MKAKLYLLALLSAFSLPLSAFSQGSLTPPGAPAASMKSLAQIEPRTPIATTPFAINAPGSYYLTTNLIVSSANGININANGVTIDLNGFTISSIAASATGTGIHIGSAVTADITILNGHIVGGVTNNGAIYGGPGFANGIDHFSTANPNNVRVANVTVSGCLDNGINLGSGNSTLVESCLVQMVGGNGIAAATVLRSSAFSCGTNGIVAVNASDCHCEHNGNYGIVCNGGTVSRCTANNNENDGIDMIIGTVSGCVADNNVGDGISLGSDCIVRDCEASGNTGNGINAGNDVLINGCILAGNVYNGIAAGDVCKAADCVVAGNGIYGIITIDNGQVTGCHVNGNTSGGVSVASFSLVRDNMVDFQEETTTTQGITASGNMNRIEANNITRCGIGLKVKSTANLIIRNSVSGSTGVAYSIVAGNSVGAIVQPASSSAISGSIGGGMGGAGATDPTANFTY